MILRNFLYLFRFFYRFIFWSVISLVCLTTAITAILVIKLSYGPINLDLLKPRIERSLTSQDGKLHTTIGKIQLARVPESVRFFIIAKRVQIFNSETQSPICNMPKIGLYFSPSTILKGKWLPKRITLYSPEIHVQRTSDGEFQLTPSSSDDKPQISQEWLTLLQEILSSKTLKQLNIVDGIIHIEDYQQLLPWTLNNVNLRAKHKNKIIDLTGHFEFESVHADLSLTLDTKATDNLSHTMPLQVQASFRNLPFEKLHTLWPEFLAPLPRTWVLKNLSDGHVPQANIQMSATLTPLSTTNQITLEELAGKIDFNDMTVDYFDGLPTVKKVDGFATFDKKNFYITPTTGSLNGLRITGGKLHITDLDLKDQDMTIDLDVEGPVRDALEVLDHPTLEFVKRFGLSAQKVSGHSTSHLFFSFPVETTLTIDKVKVEAQAKLHEVSIPQVIKLGKEYPELNLTKANLELFVSKEHLETSGTALLNDIPVSLSWYEKFSSTKDWTAQYTLKAKPDDKLLSKFLPNILLNGQPLIDLTFHEYGKKYGRLNIKADLADATVKLPVLGVVKQHKESCKAEIEMLIKHGNVVQIPRFTISGHNLKVAAKADFSSDGTRLQSISCDKCVIGNTDIQLHGKYGDRKQWVVNLSGEQLDIEPLLSHMYEDLDSNQIPMNLTVNLAKVRFGEERILTQFQGQLDNDGKEWQKIHLLGHLSGQTGGNPNFLELERNPIETGAYCQIKANDAGAVFRLFNISQSAKRGQLLVTAQKSNNNQAGQIDTWNGKVRIKTFHLSNAPAMTQLLSLSSPFGIFDAITGHTISFDTFTSNFLWKSGKLLMKDGRASGSSLGLTISGMVDLSQDTINLHGTVLPYNALNNFLVKIPVVGQLLGGEHGGIWGVSYSMQGTMDKPEVTVNPFSALTPGFLRSIFEPSEEAIDPKGDFKETGETLAPIRSPS